MATLLKAKADAASDAIALVDEAGESTWAAFNARVNRAIDALRAAGIGPGSRIAIFAGNGREYYEIMAAATHIGVNYVPVNWHFTAEELAYVIADAGADALFTDAEFAPAALAAVRRPDAPSLKLRVEVAGVSGQVSADFIDYEAWLHDNTSADEPADESMGGPMFYTSGTTGRPKGVLSALSGGGAPLAMMAGVSTGLSSLLSLPADGTTLLAGPVYHSAQWAFSFLPLLAGSTVVSRRKFDAAETLALIDAHNITNVHLVPTQFHRLLRLDEADRRDFSGASLTAVWHGAAPCPPEVKRQMIDWWGPHIFEYYGSTEGAIVSTISSDEWLERPGSIGKPTGMMEVRIVKDDGELAATGEEGTIYMKSLAGSDFEYHNDPEKTAEAHLEPGVFTTGDIGYLDADGYLYMSDRKIDMIISGGVNIYPAEIEAVLLQHVAVHDAAVFGVPNDEFGEEVKAAVEVVPSLEASEKLTQDLMAHCREHLAGYKTPRSIDYVVSLPRTETGKLQKRLLRDPYWSGRQRKI